MPRGPHCVEILSWTVKATRVTCTRAAMCALGMQQEHLLQSGLETMQLVLIDTLDYETKLKLNQPLDFEQVALPRVCFL